MTTGPDEFSVKTLNDSVKFYLPRVEGYLEIVRGMASRYGGMSLIEFDGYLKANLNQSNTLRLKFTQMILMNNA